MGKGIFILGTDTDVGKTFVTAGLVHVLRKNGYNTCSFKPVQSGGLETKEGLIPTDAEFVKKVANIDEDLKNLYSYCLKKPASPHLSAQIENIKIQPEKIMKDYKTLADQYDLVVVEGSGGAVVPLIDENYTISNLMKDLNLPVIIVARAGLGTINHTCLTVHYAEALGVEIKGIIINGYKGSIIEDDNIKMIEKITKKSILGTINQLPSVENEKELIKNIRSEFEKNINIKKLNL